MEWMHITVLENGDQIKDPLLTLDASCCVERLNWVCPNPGKLLLNRAAPPPVWLCDNPDAGVLVEENAEKLGRGTEDEKEGVAEPVGTAIEARNGFALPPPVICGRRKLVPAEPGETGELIAPLPFDPNNCFPVVWALRTPRIGF